MPIYEYRCSQNHKSERFYHFKNTQDAILCDTCGNPAKKIISHVAIVFKGSGFFVTDQRKELEEAKTPI